MKNKFVIFSLAFSLSLVLGLPVLAQGLKSAGNVVGGIAESAGANTYEKPQELIGAGISAALTLVGLIFLILMIYAGYLWLTARGEEEPINKAKKIIVSSIIGFVLVASAYSITFFIGNRFEQGSKGSGDDGENASTTDSNLGGESLVCCRICKEKLLDNFYDDPEYIPMNEKDCKDMCKGEDPGECYLDALPSILPSQCKIEAFPYDCDAHITDAHDVKS